MYRYFRGFVILMILLNSMMLAVDHFGIDSETERMLAIADKIFVGHGGGLGYFQRGVPMGHVSGPIPPW